MWETTRVQNDKELPHQVPPHQVPSHTNQALNVMPEARGQAWACNRAGVDRRSLEDPTRPPSTTVFNTTTTKSLELWTVLNNNK